MKRLSTIIIIAKKYEEFATTVDTSGEKFRKPKPFGSMSNIRMKKLKER